MNESCWDPDEFDEAMFELMCVSEVETIAEALRRLEGAASGRRRLEREDALGPPADTDTRPVNVKAQSNVRATDTAAAAAAVSNQPKQVNRLDGEQKCRVGRGRGRLYSADGKVNDIGRSIEKQVREVLGDHHQDQVFMKMYHKHLENGSKVTEERSHKAEKSSKIKPHQSSKPSSHPPVNTLQSAQPHPVVNKKSYIEDWLKAVDCSDGRMSHFSRHYQRGEEAAKPKDIISEVDRLKKLVSDTDLKMKASPTCDGAASTSREYVATQTTDWCPLGDESTDFKLLDTDFPPLSESSANVNETADRDTEAIAFREEAPNDCHSEAAKAEAAVANAVISEPPPPPPPQQSKLLVIDNYPVNVNACTLRECFEAYGEIETVQLEIAKEFCKVYIRGAEDVLEWIRCCYDDQPGNGKDSTPFKAYFKEN